MSQRRTFVFFQLQDKATLLTAERKKRGKTIPEGLATSEQIRTFRQQASHTVRFIRGMNLSGLSRVVLYCCWFQKMTRLLAVLQGLHSASVPGILALDVCLRDTSKIVTGGNDKNVTVFNKDTNQVMCILEGHSKKVTSVIYHPEEVSKETVQRNIPECWTQCPENFCGGFIYLSGIGVQRFARSDDSCLGNPVEELRTRDSGSRRFCQRYQLARYWRLLAQFWS